MLRLPATLGNPLHLMLAMSRLDESAGERPDDRHGAFAPRGVVDYPICAPSIWPLRVRSQANELVQKARGALLRHAADDIDVARGGVQVAGLGESGAREDNHAANEDEKTS